MRGDVTYAEGRWAVCHVGTGNPGRAPLRGFLFQRGTPIAPP